MLRSVVEGEWKLIFDADTGATELFHLGEDPGERRNLFSPSHPDGLRLAARLRQQVARNKKLSSRFKSKGVALSAEEMERLKSLGYL
jgi:hypothetical protein